MAGETVKAAAFLVQGISALSISFNTVLTGFVYAWPSYTMELFKSNSTMLSTKMTTTDISLLGSLTNIGGFIATPFCGYAMDKIGRKYTVMLFGLPFVLTWSLILVSTSVHIILFAIALAGFTAASQAVASVYISEISQDSIRGALTSIPIIGFIIGLLASYAIGGYLSYYHVIYVHLICSVTYILMVSILKESPVYLMQMNREEEAIQSVAFYRQINKNSKAVAIAINKIKLQLDPRLARIQDEDDLELANELVEKASNNATDNNESAWQFLRNSESSKRALVTVLIIMTLTISMGSLVIQMYAEVLFKEAIPTMDPNTCCLLLCLVYFTASTICTFIIDKVGRKFLLTISAVGTGLLSSLLGSQLHLRWAPHWFSAFVIYAYCFVNNLGVAAVPCVLTSEVFLPQVRSIGNSCAMTWMWIMNFVVLVIFNPIVEFCGLGPTFYVFSAISFITASYSHFCLPETKGLPANAIQLLFVKNKKQVEFNR